MNVKYLLSLHKCGKNGKTLVNMFHHIYQVCFELGGCVLTSETSCHQQLVLLDKAVLTV